MSDVEFFFDYSCPWTYMAFTRLRDVAALKGWRREVFGEDALRLCNGEIALTAVGSDLKVVEL